MLLKANGSVLRAPRPSGPRARPDAGAASAADPRTGQEKARAAPPELKRPWGEILLQTFNEIRDDLLSALWLVLGNAEDAQDVAQEVFLRCWRSQESLSEVHDLRAWIFRIGLNAAKDLQRSAWRRRVKPLLHEEHVPQLDRDPTCELEVRETLQRLREALPHLRAEEKEVFLLRQNGELTYEQIAQVCARPVGTVKTQMRSALHKLRKVLV